MFVESKEKPTVGHLMGVATNILLGCFNIGFVLVGNTDVGDILGVQLSWGDNAS